MGSSSSSDRRTGQIRVTAQPPFADIEILDFALRTVAVGVGDVDVELPDGIYELIAAVGSSMSRVLVRVRAGERITPLLEVPDPTSLGPAPQSTSWTEEAVNAAEQLSTSHIGAGNSAIVLMFQREPRPNPESRLTVWLEASTRLVWNIDNDDWDAGPGWMGWSGRLPAGGYLLHVKHSIGPGIPSHVTVPIWLSRGAVTMCFFDQGDPAHPPALTSIHTSDIAMVWMPYEATSLALEAVLNAERNARTLRLPSAMFLLASARNPNKIFGFLTATAMLRVPQPNFRDVSALLAYLREDLADHPDYHALELIATDRLLRLGTPAERDDVHFSPPDGIRWPPSLAWLYEAVIELDARRPGIVIPESMADIRCAQRIRESTWSTFGEPDGVEALPRIEVDAEGFAGLRITPDAPPETQLVTRYLMRYARVNKVERVDQLSALIDIPTLAWATGLTTAAVRRALNDTTPDVGRDHRNPFIPGGPFEQPDAADPNAEDDVSEVEDVEEPVEEREPVGV